MQNTFKNVRTCPAPARYSPEFAHSITSRPLPCFANRHCAALVFPSQALSQSKYHSPSWYGATHTNQHYSPRVPNYKKSTTTWPLGRSEDGKLGQTRTLRAHSFSTSARACKGSNRGSLEDVKRFLRKQSVPEGIFEAHDWAHLLLSTRRKYGDEGAWQVFLELRERGRGEVLSWSTAEVFRDHILAAALNSKSRMVMLFGHAEHLRDRHDFVWPDLYIRVLHFYLAAADYESAFFWHLRLAPTFPPTADVFGALIASFAVDPAPKLQSTLTTMYVFSTHRKLYDHLIPILFDFGRSKLARSWRKKLLTFQDQPLTSRSRSFLLFMNRYYPQVRLEDEEIEIAELDPAEVASYDEGRQAVSNKPKEHGLLSDAMVAKWFASTWTSPEFAINLMQKLGLRVVGPLALQSLALREEDAQGFFDHVLQLEKLGMKISPGVYCRALVLFAKKQETELFADLLASDIHPDEFEDLETRQLLSASAAQKRDWRLERLLQGVEWAAEERTMSRKLNNILTNNLRGTTLGKSRLIVDRMESLNVDMVPKNAAVLLKRVYKHVDFHPNKYLQYHFGLGQDPRLDRAIDITRKIALRDVAVPIIYWQKLLYNLGRLGRINDLEELSLHILQLYQPSSGLIRVHRLDLPHHPAKDVQEDSGLTKHSSNDGFFDNAPEEVSTRLTTQEFLSKLFPSADASNDAFRGSHISKPVKARSKDRDYDEKGESKADDFIPADLPFTHPNHPVRLIFNPRLQRAIVRWGFDQSMASEPTKAAILGVQLSTSSAFDLASGVHLLSKLRDNGVLIDEQVIRSCLLSRMGLAGVPRRPRARSRDEAQLDPKRIKRHVDAAWGREILPPLPELLCELENQKPKLWGRYSKLFAKSFDPEHSG